MMITARIPVIVPSANEWTFKTRWVYLAHRDKWYALLRCALKPIHAPASKVWMRLTCHRVKLLDYGNYVGGSKMIPDGLKRMGYLRDDSPEWFDCKYLQYKCKKVDQVTIIELSDQPFTDK